MKKLSDSKYKLTDLSGGFVAGIGVFVLIAAGIAGYSMIGENPDDMTLSALLIMLLTGFGIIAAGGLVEVLIEIAVNIRILAQKVLDENPDE